MVQLAGGEMKMRSEEIDVLNSLNLLNFLSLNKKKNSIVFKTITPQNIFILKYYKNTSFYLFALDSLIAVVFDKMNVGEG